MTPSSGEFVEAALALRPLVASASEQIDRERDIPEQLIRAMAHAGIFGMGTPAAYGGSAADLITKMTVIEGSSSSPSKRSSASSTLGSSATRIACTSS